MIYFLDTCSLLNLENEVLNFIKDNKIIKVSDITIKELENIKTSKTKDLSIKIKAEKASKLLNYLCFNSKSPIEYNPIENFDYTIEVKNPDEAIILTAQRLSREEENNLLFITDDLSCRLNAAAAHLQTACSEDFINGLDEINNVICCKDDIELANFYELLYNKDFINNYKINNYLFLLENNKELEVYKNKINKDTKKKEFLKVEYNYLNSSLFGTIKPKDLYQVAAIDSLKHDKLTLLEGPAGSGKSLLAMAYAFQQIESGKASKLILLANPVATKGSAKLGYLPGTRLDKLMDSQIGNFLISKMSSRYEVEQYIERENLVLLPISDIRGLDINSESKCIVYITEAQNMSKELMKLALQRCGDKCQVILDGDTKHTQVDLDLYEGDNNGLRRVAEVFEGQDFFGKVELKNIYRSKIAEIAERI